MAILFEIFPLIVFFVIFFIYDIFAATAAAIVASAIQVTTYWLRHRKFQKLHLVSLAILVTLGGLTIVLHDKAFVMWKPTAIYWALALLFLGSHFIGEKTMIQRAFSSVGDHFNIPKNIWARLNISWTILFITIGAVNIYFVKDYQDAENAFRIGVPGGGELVPVPRSIGFSLSPTQFYKFVTQFSEDKYGCASKYNGTARELCENASRKERHWLYFKVPGSIGLTLLLSFVQVFFMMRYTNPDNPLGTTLNNHSSDNSLSTSDRTTD